MLSPNPPLGVVFHWLGGLASASFYVPYKRVRRWSWEIFWLAGGVFSWVVAPWSFAALRTHDLLGVLGTAPVHALFWCWLWGAAWGFGGLTFGLTMRYLGLSLGMAMVLGLTTVTGTLGPPLFHGTLGDILASGSGRITMAGILVTLAGMVLVAQAGRAKERELAQGGVVQGVAEFDLRRGIAIALFSGAMSGCFAWGLDAGQPIRELTLAAGTDPLAQGLPVLCVVLAGGFTTNFVWCLLLIRRNGSAGQFLGRGAAPDAESDVQGAGTPPLLRNYALSAFGGTLWYFQFFFYTMGESQMGSYKFSSWTLHMASIILFSTLWGFALREWAGAGRRARALIWSGVGCLVGSTIIIGVGNYAALS